MAALFGRAKRGLLVGGLGAAIAGKVYLYKKYKAFTHGHDPEQSSGFTNRRSFGGLPRRKQREVIYRKRAQLRDFESIAYGGYQPIGGRRRRRRLGWGG